MKTIDFRKSHKERYTAGKKITLLPADRGSYLCVDGEGAPGGEAYVAAIGQLFGVAYTAKFGVLRPAGVDYRVPPLENLWPPGDYH